MKKTYGRVPKGTTISRIKETLSKTNREMIDEFVVFKKGSVIEKRLTLIHNSLVKFADLLEIDFDKASKDDITRAWNIIYSSTDISVKSKQDEYLHIRQVFKHWFGEDEEFPKTVRGMTRPKGRGLLKLPDEMPTEEKIYSAVKLCCNYRDKFFVAYEGLDAGARPVELRRLKWKDLKKDDHGYYFNIKTAKESGDYEERPIRIIFSEPYLLDWMKNYPGTRDDENYVFCRLDDPTTPIAHGALATLFRQLKKKLGIKGKFSPYVLRHATLTRMGKNPNVSLSVLKKFAGHTQTSNIIGAYQHYGSDDVKDMQLGYAGREKKEDDRLYELKKAPLKCPHCGKSNQWDAEVCGFCNFALSQRKNIEFEEYKKRIEILEKKEEKFYSLIEDLKVTVGQLKHMAGKK
jgi:integrase